MGRRFQRCGIRHSGSCFHAADHINTEHDWKLRQSKNNAQLVGKHCIGAGITTILNDSHKTGYILSACRHQYRGGSHGHTMQHDVGSRIVFFNFRRPKNNLPAFFYPHSNIAAFAFPGGTEIRCQNLIPSIQIRAHIVSYITLVPAISVHKNSPAFTRILGRVAGRRQMPSICRNRAPLFH